MSSNSASLRETQPDLNELVRRSFKKRLGDGVIFERDIKYVSRPIYVKKSKRTK